MFDLDLQSRTPIYEQLYRKIVELAVSGVLAEGTQLPSVRQLAKELSVNPNTVSKAYQNLERDGMIYSLAGRGSFIGKIQAAEIHTDMLEEFDKAVGNALRLGISADVLCERIRQMNVQKTEDEVADIRSA